MTKTYQKDNSFLAIKQLSPKREDVLSRLRGLWRDLSRQPPTSYQAKIVAQACQELFQSTTNPNMSPFSLRDYIIEEIERLEDGQLERYLFYRYRYEVFPERKLLDDFPPLLQIEPTSICNYRCVFCYQRESFFTEPKKGQMGMMPLDLFKRIIDLVEGNCEAVTLASRGEPLICKDIVSMLRYA